MQLALLHRIHVLLRTTAVPVVYPQSTVQSRFRLQLADSENVPGGRFASRRLSFPIQMAGASDDGAVAPHLLGAGTVVAPYRPGRRTAVRAGSVVRGRREVLG